MSKRKTVLLCFAALLAAFIIFTVWENLNPGTTVYEVPSADLPAAFDGLRIAQVSDLHNTSYGSDHETLLAMLRNARPDLIVITGDFIDSYDTDVDVSLSFARQAVAIAPVYYCSGNHESRLSEEYARLRQGLKDAGVTLLENESVIISRGGQKLRLAGINDPNFYTARPDDDTMNGLLMGLGLDDTYTVLLTHRPEYFHCYTEHGIDLALSGHAHGGQLRVPGIGAIFAPNQGFFPEYADGVHTSGETTMIISRGLGNSSLPFRLFNRPELVVAELTCE